MSINVGQMEAVEIANEKIRELNSRIDAGEDVLKMCKEQMRILRAHRKVVIEFKNAYAEGNMLKINRLRAMLNAGQNPERSVATESQSGNQKPENKK